MSTTYLRNTDLILWREAKAKAALQGISLKALVEDALRKYLKKKEA